MAVEFSYRFRETSPEASVFWVSAGTVARFEADYRNMAKRIKVPGVDDPKTDILSLVKGWLESSDSGNWLLILDDLDDVALLKPGFKETSRRASITTFLPKNASGCVLLTTRNTKVGHLVAGRSNTISIGPIDQEVGIRIIRQRLPDFIAFSDEDLNTLLEILEYLPLAITQACSFIAENNISVSEYVEVFRGNSEDVLELLSEDLPDITRDQFRPNAIIRTFLMTFDQIRSESPKAADFLSLMSMLDWQQIPRFLIYEPDNPLNYKSAMQHLEAYSMVKVVDKQGTIAVHRLIHLATKRWLRLQGTSVYWEAEALRTVAEHFPNSESQTREILERCALLLPHAQAVLKTTDRQNLLFATLLHDTATYLWILAKYEDARHTVAEALQLRTNILGSDDVTALSSLRLLGNILLSAGKYNQAEKSIERVLLIYKSVVGSENIEQLRIVQDLADICLSQGKYNEAEELTRQALKGFEKEFGVEHSDTLRSAGNLASVLECEGKYEAAEKINRQTLELKEKVLGKEHLFTLGSMNNLATVLASQSKYEEAETIHRQALQLREKALGMEHPSSLDSMSNLAFVLERQGKYDEAEALQRQALELKEKVLGAEHPNTLTSMSNLAVVLNSQDKCEEAEALQRQALKLKEKVLGIEHPSSLDSMSNLAFVLERQGKYDEAETLQRQALELKEKVLGAEHPNTLTSMSNLAVVLDSQGKHAAAEQTRQRILELEQNMLGTKLP